MEAYAVNSKSDRARFCNEKIISMKHENNTKILHERNKEIPNRSLKYKLCGLLANNHRLLELNLNDNDQEARTCN